MLVQGIKPNQFLKIELRPITATGKPAKIDGVPVWTVTDGDKALLVVEPSGLTATFTPVAGTESFAGEVVADADLGEGVRHLTGTFEVSVGDEADSLGLVGTVGEQPTPAARRR
jgi:hypothetical protein